MTIELASLRVLTACAVSADPLRAGGNRALRRRDAARVTAGFGDLPFFGCPRALHGPLLTARFGRRAALASA